MYFGSKAMFASSRQSPFIDPAAVEAWDAWFRWRDQAGLHDVSIEDTWHRVAAALASVETVGITTLWRSRFFDAFASWRLLPDERLLAMAGTGQIAWRGTALRAVLNVASFVPADRDPPCEIDATAVAECAELAVHALDNAALIAGIPVSQLRIGMIGVGDALALLGLGYDSNEGRALAIALGGALAEGCLRGSIKLAIARGASTDDARRAIACASRRELPPELLRDAARHGLRYLQLTAITSQPMLALLANNVADALDPLGGENHPHVIAVPGGERTIRSSGYALNVLGRAEYADRDKPDTLENLPWQAQLAMRAAVQPWMDEPITYPLLLKCEPDSQQTMEATQQAALHGLGAPAWRISSAPRSCDSTATRGSTIA